MRNRNSASTPRVWAVLGSQRSQTSGSSAGKSAVVAPTMAW
ncbi:hypothetical protein EHYA_08396 [Embleya hyalina]|uniref:Uncharacterized protein n=1 Tax=Embleya hyalina TaxID=516124 RepID=A0A401Z1A0_9ACTN|nr:hypothetical protein EHYA_08396 [Embleya hyalina]